MYFKNSTTFDKIFFPKCTFVVLAFLLFSGCARTWDKTNFKDKSDSGAYLSSQDEFSQSDVHSFQVDDSEDYSAPDEKVLIASAPPVSPPRVRGFLAKSESRPQSAYTTEGSSSSANLSGTRPDSPTSATVAPDSSNRRMIHYNGYLLLQTSSPQSLLDSVQVLAKWDGGYIESRTEWGMIIRIPPDKFLGYFNLLSKLAPVLSQNLTANDITKQFEDVGFRLALSENLRKRYRQLLGEAIQEQQKIELLKEIARLTEEIERFNLRKNELLQQASFSTLTLSLESLSPNLGANEKKPPLIFDWIRHLDPFNSKALTKGWFKPKAVIPKGFVKLKKGGGALTHLVSGEGAEIRVRYLKPKALAQTSFWAAAVYNHFIPQYASVDSLEFANYFLVKIKSHGVNPYEYWVGIQKQKPGKKFKLWEIYFPSEEVGLRYKESVLSSLNSRESN